MDVVVVVVVVGGGFAPAGAEKQKRKRYFESARHVLRIFHARVPVKLLREYMTRRSSLESMCSSCPSTIYLYTYIREIYL